MANPLIPDVKYATLITEGDGAKTEWEFNFAGGYISRDHVKAFTEDKVTGQLVIRTLEFTGPNTVRIAPAVANGLRLIIYRDTPKTGPIVNYTDGSVMSEANLDKSNQQAVFIAAELADRVVSDYDFSTALLYAVETATLALSVANGIDGKAQSALDASATALSVATSASAVLSADGVYKVGKGVAHEPLVTGFNSTGVPDGTVIVFKARSFADDGAGGTFVFHRTATAAANGGTVFAPTGGGRLYRDGWTVFGYNGKVSVLWFGVRGETYSADDYVPMSEAIAYQETVRCELTVPPSIRIRIGTPLDMPPTLHISGEGAAVQLAPSFVSVGGSAIFRTRPGFGSESCVFSGLCFDSATPGTGIGFYGRTTDYLSQATWRNCTWKSNLLYGINCPIILNSFYDCDFGSYPGAYQNFTAILSVGSGGIEPNANTFFRCVFRKSTAASVIDTRSTGVQWNFYACDWEQNKCTDVIIRYDGGGSVNFYGGYVENNDTPYFFRVIGSLAVTFSQVVRLHGMHFNDPAKLAVVKRELAYPTFDIQGCYGKLNCNVSQNEFGTFNSYDDIEVSTGNYFLAGTGAIGAWATVNSGGYNSRKWRVRELRADLVNAVTKTGVSVSGPTVVATLVSILPGVTSYAGTVTIMAVSGPEVIGGAANTASYLLNVSSGGVASAALVSAAGVTGGGAANHPSFTWTLAPSGVLSATPIGSTSGMFSFVLSCAGSVYVT